MAVSFITPKYIYKILPSTPPPPSPLPLALPVSALDARDNFIHLSTSRQVIGTLRNFFANENYVWMLRIPYTQVEKWIKWENSVGKGPDEPVRGGCWDTTGSMGYFPHIHGNGLKLGIEEVESVGKWERGSGEWGPTGWPFDEDTPKV